MYLIWILFCGKRFGTGRVDAEEGNNKMLRFVGSAEGHKVIGKFNTK